MIPAHDIAKVRETLQNAKSVLVVIGQKPNIDSAAAALSLYFALEKQGKSAQVVCQTLPTVGFGEVIGIDKITNELQGRNLVISIDYIEGSIEKVSYNLDGDKFNLVIHTPPDAKPITKDKIHYATAGIDTDCIVAIGCASSSDAGTFLTGSNQLTTKAPIINIDYHQNNANFGQVNIVDRTAHSCCEMIFAIIKALAVEADPDIAANIYLGISSATNHFQDQYISAEVFEAAAWCLRNGAKISQVPPFRSPQVNSAGQTQDRVSESKIPSAVFKQPFSPGDAASDEFFTNLFAPTNQPTPMQSGQVKGDQSRPSRPPMPLVTPQKQPAPIYSGQTAPITTNRPSQGDETSDQDPNQPDIDPSWVAPPKIYRGGSES